MASNLGIGDRWWSLSLIIVQLKFGGSTCARFW